MRSETIGTLLSWGIHSLKKADILEAQADAEVLFSHLLQIPRPYLYVSENVISGDIANQYRTSIQRRMAHEPVQYITGVQEFWSLPFAIIPGVLVPRPETECLIEVALKKIGTRRNDPLSILDIGCGSGIIGIVLARECKQAEITAVDISETALNLSRENAKRHEVFDRLQFKKSDLFSSLPSQQFDLILSNPPYIKEADWVKNFEPREALRGGKEGIDIHCKIIQEAQYHLKRGGYLLMEMAWDQGGRLQAEFKKQGSYKNIFVQPDYEQRERIIGARCVG